MVGDMVVKEDGVGVEIVVEVREIGCGDESEYSICVHLPVLFLERCSVARCHLSVGGERLTTGWGDRVSKDYHSRVRCIRGKVTNRTTDEILEPIKNEVENVMKWLKSAKVYRWKY